MLLSALLRDAGLAPTGPVAADPAILDIAADSRVVRPGTLFFALAGVRADGARFALDAVARGAVAVATGIDAPMDDLPAGVPVLRFASPRHALVRVAAVLAGPQPRWIAAVTGTNGKTSTADFARQIWTTLGRPAASVGTLGIVSSTLRRPAGLTTPDPVSLHRDLALLAASGVDRVALEASSHGLDQSRLDGISPCAAAFTNLTHEHLDYHASMDGYFEAKARLFTHLLANDGTAIVNADSDRAGQLNALCRARGLRAWTYGVAGDELRIERRVPRAGGQMLSLSVFGARIEIDLPLIGDFMAANALAALGMVVAAGEDAGAATGALEKLRGAPGRIEHVATTMSGAAVYVDYAHKPDALEQVLRALRSCASGRLILVFGCGGDRDRAKRPLMGAIAARLADRVFVTDDNPRGETPSAIRRAVMGGVPSGSDHVVEIADGRRAAIAAALEIATCASDVVVIAGKGHETGQTIGAVTHPFDDSAVARELTGVDATGAAA